ncbi:MAG TPA: hypothetical protein VG816_09950 [Solirubrobacterales bacterium]|nr:hypothetical protein [Solirubrobacterales bacterium]
MTEGRELAAVLDGQFNDQIANRAVQVAPDAPDGDRAQEAFMKIVEMADHDPGRARKALWALRGDAGALEGLEHRLGLSPCRATLALGGAIQLASTELASAKPDLRGRVPELMRWLEGSW